MMLCREVLLEIRKKREEEFREFRESLSKTEPSFCFVKTPTSAQEDHIHPHSFQISSQIETFIKKRQAILTLELPFKTDTFSIGAALQKSMDKPEDKQASIIQLINKWRDGGTRDQQYARKHIYKVLTEEIFSKILSVKFDSEGNESTSILSKLAPEELQYALSPEIILDAINRKTTNPDSRKVYKSLVKDLWDLLNSQETHLYKNSPIAGIPAEILASYLEHLEQRCLKAKISDKPYRNLLEIRTLLYLPLPCTQLNKIVIADIENLNFTAGSNKTKGHPLPSSFIVLAKAMLSENEPILRRNAKQLGRFIDQSALAANLGGKVKLKQIQRSMKRICQKEGYLTEYLPYR